MEVKDIEKIEKQRGIASTIKSKDLIPAYAEGVERFSGNNQRDVFGSSTDMGVALATFCPEVPLITGQQLLELYSQAGNKNPFGSVYIDFGVQINGEPNINSSQAKILLRDFKDKKIKFEQGRVPDFNQLRLVADKDDKEVGLAYKLANDISSDDIAHVSAYPFKGGAGKNGLFGACLDGDGYWCAYGGGLHVSSGSGRNGSL